MLKLKLVDGGKSIYVNPAHVVMVGHAYDPPKPGVPAAMAIPKLVGAMVLVPGAQIAVEGNADQIAAAVAGLTGKAIADPSAGLQS